MQSIFQPQQSTSFSLFCSHIQFFEKFCRILLDKDPEAEQREKKKSEGLLRTKRGLFFLEAIS